MINFIQEYNSFRLSTFDFRPIPRWIRAVAAGYGFAVGDITYIFCSDERILEVNRQFLLDAIPYLRRHLYLPGYGCVQCAEVRNSV